MTINSKIFFHLNQLYLPQSNFLVPQWKGAVLFLCNQSHLFLIHRTESMPTHPGQMAFFGGHRQAGEKNPQEVVAREFEEESGICSSKLKLGVVIGSLWSNPQSAYECVWGVLELTSHDFMSQVKSNGEWDSLFAIPLEHIIESSLWTYGYYHGQGVREVLFFPLSHTSIMNSGKKVESRPVLWGATANVIWKVFKDLKEKL